MTEARHVHRILRVWVEGPVLLGGYTGADPNANLTTAVVVEGDRTIPILTASALKGALREAALLIERSDDTIADKTPMSWENASERTATAVERVLGASSGRLVAPPPGQPSLEKMARDRGWMEHGVRISDARPVGAPPVLGVRHGVAIDRFTRARSRGRLYRKQVAECAGQDNAFEATITGWLSDEDLELLADTARLVTRLGNSTSRGLGRVRMELVQGPATPDRALELPAAAPAQGELWIEVIALEPLHLGGLQVGGNVRETLDYVPGGALRGALVAAARRAARGNAALDKLVSSGCLWQKGSLNLSDLLPAHGLAGLPFPAPRTLLAEKRRLTPGRGDRCIALAVAAELAREQQGVVRLGLDRGDDIALEPVQGRLRSAALSTRQVTRLALDPYTRSKAHGQLYVVQQIEPGARFLGTLSGVGPEVWRALDLLARSGEPIYVGALRSRGLGRVQIRIVQPGREDLDQRLRAFRRKAERDLGPLAAQLGWQPARLVQVVARTPLAAPAETDLSTWLAGQLFPEGATPRGSWVRTESRSGWFDKDGRPEPVVQVASPGSTWLFELAGDAPLNRMREAERAGIGDRVELGLGRLIFSPDTELR